MLRYLVLIGALAAMPLSSFAAVEWADRGAADPTTSLQQDKAEGPVWVVDATRTSPTQGPVWVVIKSKGINTVS